MVGKIKEKNFYPIFFITIVVLISISLLVGINNIVSPRIKAQEIEKINMLLEKIFPEIDDYIYEDEIYFIYSNDEKIGYAFLADGYGYGGSINLLVGIDLNFDIKGIDVISHTETPGLGSRITEDSFKQQFKGLTPDDIALRKDDGKIDAITGATISSTAVAEAIREEMLEKISIIEIKH